MRKLLFLIITILFLSASSAYAAFGDDSGWDEGKDYEILYDLPMALTWDIMNGSKTTDCNYSMYYKSCLTRPAYECEMSCGAVINCEGAFYYYVWAWPVKFKARPTGMYQIEYMDQTVEFEFVNGYGYGPLL